MQNENVSARHISLQKKSDCFSRNIPMLNVFYYVGKGFMLRKQLVAIMRIFYKINEHSVNDMLQDLLKNGLVIKKQATDTRTYVYVLTKFSTSKFQNGNILSTRDAKSIKLNNRKLWNNIYRTEFIIREIVPMMEQTNYELDLSNLFQFLYDYNISIYSTENQSSIFQLYEYIKKAFPINEMDLIEQGANIYSPFMNDYYKAKAELFNHQNNFLGYKIEDDYSDAISVKEEIERMKDLYSSPKEVRKSCYNLFNMVAAGFFFIGGVDTEKESITIGSFDKCNNMNLKKIYDNAICIMLMLERYLGYYPTINIRIYMSDSDNLQSLRDKEIENGYDYQKMETINLTKRDLFFKNYNIGKQYWENIQVDYIYYPLKEKYNI